MRKVRVVAAVGVAALTGLVLAVTAGAQRSYTDPTGDAGAGTDITTITVRNDLSGLISIQVGSASPIVGNHAIALFIDTDKNPGTGDDGIEAWMFAGPLVGSEYFRCSSSGCSSARPPSFQAGAAGPNVTEFRIHRADLGNTTGFNFIAISISIDPPYVNFWDAAPNAGWFTYDVVFPQCSNGQDDDGDGLVDAQDPGCASPADDDESDEPVTIRLGAAKATPAAPRAGSVVTIAAPATRVETGRPLENGAVRCTAKYAPNRTVRGSGSVVGGRATCKLKLPAASRGKTVRGTMTLTYRSASATKAFTFRVK